MKMKFSDFEDKSSDSYVAEDGSAGYLKDGMRRQTHYSFVPSSVSWGDWVGERALGEKPRAMRIPYEKIQEVRAEIARRWTDMMNSYVRNDV